MTDQSDIERLIAAVERGNQRLRLIQHSSSATAAMILLGLLWGFTIR